MAAAVAFPKAKTSWWLFHKEIGLTEFKLFRVITAKLFDLTMSGDIIMSSFQLRFWICPLNYF